MKRQNGHSQDWTAGYRAAVNDETAPGASWAGFAAAVGLLLAGAALAWVALGLIG